MNTYLPGVAGQNIFIEHCVDSNFSLRSFPPELSLISIEPNRSSVKRICTKKKNTKDLCDELKHWNSLRLNHFWSLRDSAPNRIELILSGTYRWHQSTKKPKDPIQCYFNVSKFTFTPTAYMKLKSNLNNPNGLKSMRLCNNCTESDFICNRHWNQSILADEDAKKSFWKFSSNNLLFACTEDYYIPLHNDVNSIRFVWLRFWLPSTNNKVQISPIQIIQSIRTN